MAFLMTFMQPMTRLVAARPVSMNLLYVAPPKAAVIKAPKKAQLLRYYVYHPTSLYIGSCPVKVESGVRVVYMTAVMAVMYINCFMIGILPWANLPWGQRKKIAPMWYYRIAPDLPPVVNAALVDQNATHDVAWNYTFAANTFWDPDNHAATLTYVAYEVINYLAVTLPAWITFTSSTRSFAGTPPTGAVGTHKIRVTARDPWGQVGSDDFNLVVS